MSTPFKDQLHLHFIVGLWGFTSILGKIISIPSVEIVFYRTFFSVLFLLGLAMMFKKNITLPFRSGVWILLTGFIVGAHWITFFAAVKVSKVSIALAGIATCALFTSLIEPLINQTRIKVYEVLFGLLVIVGLYIIFKFEYNHTLGLLLSLASALLASVFSVLNANFTKKHSPESITVYEMGGACLCCVLFFPFYSVYFTDGAGLQLALNLSDTFYLLLLALFCTVYAFYASVELLKRVTAFNVNLITNLEPVYGILLAFMIFGADEQMTTAFYVGTAIILFSVLSYPLADKLLRRRAEAKGQRQHVPQ